MYIQKAHLSCALAFFCPSSSFVPSFVLFTCARNHHQARQPNEWKKEIILNSCNTVCSCSVFTNNEKYEGMQPAPSGKAMQKKNGSKKKPTTKKNSDKFALDYQRVHKLIWMSKIFSIIIILVMFSLLCSCIAAAAAAAAAISSPTNKLSH